MKNEPAKERQKDELGNGDHRNFRSTRISETDVQEYESRHFSDSGRQTVNPAGSRLSEKRVNTFVGNEKTAAGQSTNSANQEHRERDGNRRRFIFTLLPGHVPHNDVKERVTNPGKKRKGYSPTYISRKE